MRRRGIGGKSCHCTRRTQTIVLQDPSILKIYVERHFKNALACRHLKTLTQWICCGKPQSTYATKSAFHNEFRFVWQSDICFDTGNLDWYKTDVANNEVMVCIKLIIMDEAILKFTSMRMDSICRVLEISVLMIFGGQGSHSNESPVIRHDIYGGNVVELKKMLWLNQS